MPIDSALFRGSVEPQRRIRDPDQIITEFEPMRKRVVECLSKFQSRVVKIDRDNPIFVAKPLIGFNILRVVSL